MHTSTQEISSLTVYLLEAEDKQTMKSTLMSKKATMNNIAVDVSRAICFPQKSNCTAITVNDEGGRSTVKVGW